MSKRISREDFQNCTRLHTHKFTIAQYQNMTSPTIWSPGTALHTARFATGTQHEKDGVPTNITNPPFCGRSFLSQHSYTPDKVFQLTQQIVNGPVLVPSVF